MISEVFGDIVTQQATWAVWLIIAGAMALLAVGADKAVMAAVRLAATLGMSKVIIGATIVSLGTTMPEVFVSVTAAFRGQPDYALGNAVGSIICDTALIFGLACVLTRLPHDRFILRRQGVTKLATVALLGATVFALALAAGSFTDVVIPRWIGGLYVALLVVYMWLSVHWARQHPQSIEAQVSADAKPAADAGKARAAVISAAIVAIGLTVVAVSSDILISGVNELATRYDVNKDVLAVTMVALGTSLPELVTAIAAVSRGHGELAVGNVIGADILNVLSVAGLSALASPLRVSPAFFQLHVPVMILSTGLLGVYIFINKGTFRRWQGIPLLLIYVGYMVVLFGWFRA